MKIHDFQKFKAEKRKINFVTCYDYSFAKIFETTDVDCLLVGDSLAMTMHGEQDTLCADIEMMALHTKAVANGVNKKFVVADLPFMSYRGSLDLLNTATMKLMQAGANAIKLEGVEGNEEYINHLVHSGVPVMGHIGLTPQFVNTLGGYRVQGKTKESANILLDQAKRLEKAGCFSIVLECVPTDVAERITKELTIATIGIGAGNKTDGQVLVLQDLLGLNMDFLPKFVKKYMQGESQVKTAINKFCEEVKSGVFPCSKHSFETTIPTDKSKKAIKVFESINDIQDYLRNINRDFHVGFVPTMGNLHEGHGSLLKESIRDNDITVLSIFVNPTQFNNKDDLNNYPKTLKNDLELAEQLGVDCVFLPSSENMYHENLDFRITCTSNFATECEGGRKGHFDGMLTVVMKLLNIIKPKNAYFGEKDFQQLKLIQEMVSAFFLDVNIIPCKTVRLGSGLAMSSRNNRLSNEGVELASKVSNIIHSEKNADIATQKVNELTSNVEIIYINDIGGRRLYAFMIEKIRLIDNFALN
ncbi:3-methyl-2-oxobutanoate hydroxymethyltransferase [Francisella sp. Scap27]|nr:3-methyl-2-oxobutanoate hydroxymethyltransferase [Francisella sp. Scap27]